MNSIIQIMIFLAATLGLLVGLIHVGFALTDPYPRNIWDWYVVIMGISMVAMSWIMALGYLQWIR